MTFVQSCFSAAVTLAFSRCHLLFTSSSLSVYGQSRLVGKRHQSKGPTCFLSGGGKKVTRSQSD